MRSAARWGISDATSYVWRKKYSGVGPSESQATAAARRGEPQAQADRRGPEPGRGDAAGGWSQKKPEPLVSPGVGARVDAALRVQPAQGAACRRHVLLEGPVREEAKGEEELKLRLKEITDTRVHYGYRRVDVLLRRESHRGNVKRIYRIYREQGLSLRGRRAV